MTWVVVISILFVTVHIYIKFPHVCWYDIFPSQTNLITVIRIYITYSKTVHCAVAGRLIAWLTEDLGLVSLNDLHVRPGLRLIWSLLWDQIKKVIFLIWSLEKTVVVYHNLWRLCSLIFLKSLPLLNSVHTIFLLSFMVEVKINLDLNIIS